MEVSTITHHNVNHYFVSAGISLCALVHVCSMEVNKSVLQYSVLLGVWIVCLNLRDSYILSLPPIKPLHENNYTKREFNLIALMLLPENWQVLKSLAEHLIVFQTT